MDKIDMSLDDIIKQNRKENRKLALQKKKTAVNVKKAPTAPAGKRKLGQVKGGVQVKGRAGQLKQFRARIGGKKTLGTGVAALKRTGGAQLQQQGGVLANRGPARKIGRQRLPVKKTAGAQVVNRYRKKQQQQQQQAAQVQQRRQQGRTARQQQFNQQRGIQEPQGGRRKGIKLNRQNAGIPQTNRQQMNIQQTNTIQQQPISRRQRQKNKRLQQNQQNQIKPQKLMPQRGNAQRGNAQRVNVQRGNAQKINAQRVNAQRVNTQRVNAQRANAQRANAQRANAQKTNPKLLTISISNPRAMQNSKPVKINRNKPKMPISDGTLNDRFGQLQQPNIPKGKKQRRRNPQGGSTGGRTVLLV